MTINLNLNLEIVELAYIHKIIYDEGSGFHYLVSYLTLVNGNEIVVDAYPNSLSELKALPLTVDHNTIEIFTEHGVHLGSTSIQKEQ